jgi:hypothetical protein
LGRKIKCVSLTPELLKMVDDWRKEQKEIPSFSGALDALLNKGLEKDLVDKEKERMIHID